MGAVIALLLLRLLAGPTEGTIWLAISAVGFLLAPTGQPSVPRLIRWIMASDKAALRADIEAIAATEGLKRVIPGHGKMIHQGAAESLLTAAGTLG